MGHVLVAEGEGLSTKGDRPLHDHCRDSGMKIRNKAKPCHPPFLTLTEAMAEDSHSLDRNLVEVIGGSRTKGSTKALFEPPIPGFENLRESMVTIAELDGKILDVPVDGVEAEQPLLDYHQRGGTFYPLIQVNMSSDAPPSKQRRDSLYSVSSVPSLRQLPSSGWLGKQILSILRLHGGTDDGGDTAQSKGQKHPVRAFGWHKYLNRFAAGLCDGANDFIAVYDMESEAWLPTVLKHQFQVAVSCLAWQPFAGGCLAVGCLRGVCVWKTEPSTDPGHHPAGADAAWVTFWRMKGYDEVTTMSWSPCGKFLAVGYKSSDKCIVWDAATGEATPLTSFVPLAWLGVRGGGVQLTTWSPSGGLLLVSLGIGLFALYNTQTWEHTSHRVDGPLVSACFSPNSRYLIGAVATQTGGEMWAYVLQSGAMGGSPDMYIGRGARLEGVPGEDRPIVGLAWNATGERLVVSYGGEGGLVYVLLTECHGQTLNVRTVFRGVIHGPPQAVSSLSQAPLPPGIPSHLEFRPTFALCRGVGQRGEREGGALLSVCWENGRIASYPMYFMSVDGEQNKPRPLPRER